MKKELDYFMIDGEFGGNQDWFTNIVMNVGGCGAATACDSCIYLAKYKGMKELYPFDLEQMDKEAYKKFSQLMKPYIRPRVQGVKKPEWYIGNDKIDSIHVIFRERQTTVHYNNAVLVLKSCNVHSDLL